MTLFQFVYSFLTNVLRIPHNVVALIIAILSFAFWTFGVVVLFLAIRFLVTVPKYLKEIAENSEKNNNS